MTLKDDWTPEERLKEADKCLTEAMEDARQTHRMRVRVAELVFEQTPDNVTQKTVYEWEALERRRRALARSALRKAASAGEVTRFMSTMRIIDTRGLRHAIAQLRERESIIRAVVKASE